MTPAPQVACKLSRLLSSYYEVEELVLVARLDPHLTGRVLQACNGTQYGGRGQINSLEEAIFRLGKDEFRRTLWQATMARHMSRSLSAYRLAAGAVWRHSVRSAFAAEELWKCSEFDEEMNLAFVAGLLHDIGKILVNRALAAHTEEFYRFISDHQIAAYQAERTVLGFDHAEIGGDLMMKWVQSGALVAAVAGHHEPAQSDNKKFASLIRLASLCAHHDELSSNENIDHTMPEIDDTLREILKIEEKKLRSAMRMVRSRSEEVEVLIAIM